MPGKWRHFTFVAILAAFMRITDAAPLLTVIEDTLYKADGTRFEGIAEISWTSFRAADGSEVPAHSLSIRVMNGFFRVALVPTTTAVHPITYTVRFTSNGKTQFQEYWSVPPRPIAIRLSEVRASGPIAGPITTPPASVSITDIIGLRSELDLRIARGAGFTTSRAAIINSNGALDAVSGYSGDCVKVDGTSGPCGGSSVGGSFVDAEAPTGAADGVNRTYMLSAAPVPASSLMIFKNGLLLRAGVEFTIIGSTVTIDPASTLAAGDQLQAFFRVSSILNYNFADGEILAGTIDGTNDSFTIQHTPAPASSLQVYRNGLLQKAGIDYDMSADTIIFRAGAIPQPSDILQAHYRW